MNVWIALPALCALVLAGAPAQKPAEEPLQEILKLVEQARKDLDAAERHLLEATSRTASAGPEGRELEAAAGRQEAVVAAIQKILDSIPPDDKGGSSGPPPPNPDRRPPPEARPREREQKPDPVKPQERPGEKPSGAEHEQKAGQQDEAARNRKSVPPPEDPTGRTPPAEGREYWGNLPRFLQDIFRAGEEPRIPEKYRPFWRAFQERNQDQEKR